MADKIATREAYGRAIEALGETNPRIVVLDADLSCSTKTGYFAKKFPERFINMGVSEQDMMGTAAGLSLTGKIPFASSFAMFATGRAFEIVRNSIVYPRLNVNICATHAGLTVGEDGASHQALVDVTIMRSLPGMTVIVPADGIEAKKVIAKIAEYHGPVYVRLARASTPIILDEDYEFEIGKATVMREGKDLTIVAMGLMVYHSLEAAKILEKQGIACTVINSASVKPLDVETIGREAAKTGRVMTVEEHSVIGGLGSAVAESIAEGGKIPVHRYGVMDQFGQSGNATALLKHYKLMPEDLAAEAVAFLKKSS